METLQRLDAANVKAAVIGYRDALRAHQDGLNRLNVYPVPDGDTGTNMALTMESVVEELRSITDGDAADMSQTCKAISHGSLMGARGNSGVILSQVLRGIAEELRGLDACGPGEWADALASASDAAYGAVMRPVEGTILTVVRECAAAAGDAAGRGAALIDVLDAARAGAADALARTPEQLPVLAQAGVVDAGGAGFLLFLDSVLHVAAGRPIPEPAAPTGAAVGGASSEAGGAISAEVAEAHGDVSDLRYEVMYFLEAPDETIPAFKDVWAGIGDSIVVVGGDGIWNCHIHTDDIGAAIEAAVDCGRPRRIRVTDLSEQVDEERWVRERAAVPEEPPPLQPVTTAVVAVATGAGVGRLLRSVGVQSIVAGGQSMNPSTAQLLDAVDAAPSESVVVLPNNKNIVPVAEQLSALTSKNVVVVPTHSVLEGLASALVYDPEGDIDANVGEMRAASSSVVTGEVTRAVRDSSADAGPIVAGDFLGISRKGIQVVAKGQVDAVTGLLDVLVTDDHELVTLIEGEGSSAGDTRRITEWLAEHRPGVEVEVHHGGQPLYPYLLSVE